MFICACRDVGTEIRGSQWVRMCPDCRRSYTATATATEQEANRAAFKEPKKQLSDAKKIFLQRKKDRTKKERLSLSALSLWQVLVATS